MHEHVPVDEVAAERTPEMQYAPPVHESLFNSAARARLWPEYIAHDPSLLREVAEREHILRAMDAVDSQLPDVTVPLDDAYTEGHVTAAELCALYSGLTTLLQSDADNARMVFYLPFEYLPAPASGYDGTPLTVERERFRAAYRTAWTRLLDVHDVRANWSDGDVLDADMRSGNIPRVVKAAHLIPQLLLRKLLHIEEVLDLLEEADDPVLQRSISEALAVAFDMSLVPEDTLRRMQSSSVEPVRKLYADLMHESAPEAPVHRDPVPLPEAAAQLQHNVAQALAVRADTAHDVTEARAKWLRSDGRARAISTCATSLAESMTAGITTVEMLRAASHAQDEAFACAVLHAIALYVTHADNPRAAYMPFGELVHELSQREGEELRDALTGACSQLVASNVLTKEDCRGLGVQVPDFTAHFVASAETLGLSEAELQGVLDALEKDTVLRESVYPVLLLYGSRVKGYATRTADADAAIFVRPDVPFTKREALQKALGSALNHKHVGGSALEFWLTREGDTFGIRDFPDPDTRLGDSTLIHTLWNGVWYGKEEVLKDLHANLLAPYLTREADSDEKLCRRRLLEELERDTLQYRLMHKGYDRFFPARGRLMTRHAGRIDGSSAFWDPGYRRLATTLYVQRVFLPHVNTPKK